MAGIALKKGFSDEALFIEREVGVMMGLTRRMFLRLYTGAFGRRKQSGKAYILYHRKMREISFSHAVRKPSNIFAIGSVTRTSCVGCMYPEHKYKYIDGSHCLPKDSFSQ